MGAPSVQLDERARKNLASIFQGLSQVTQVEVAKRLDVSEPTVSRMKEKEALDIARFLAACGLKVVPEHYECEDPDYLSGLRLMARKHLESMAPAPKLEQDWDKSA